jgi:hypothetical protein
LIKELEDMGFEIFGDREDTWEGNTRRIWGLPRGLSF